MNTQAEVISIGNDAIDDQEPMVILFDEHATTAIQNVALIQHFMDEAAKKTANTDDRFCGYY